MAYSYNVDYWDGKSSIEVSADMIKLRYANYPKDYLLGVLPASQYGSVAVLPSSYLNTFSPSTVVAYTSSDPAASSNVINPASSTELETVGTATAKRNLSINSDLSALLS